MNEISTILFCKNQSSLGLEMNYKIMPPYSRNHTKESLKCVCKGSFLKFPFSWIPNQVNFIFAFCHRFLPIVSKKIFTKRSLLPQTLMVAWKRLRLKKKKNLMVAIKCYFHMLGLTHTGDTTKSYSKYAIKWKKKSVWHDKGEWMRYQKYFFWITGKKEVRNSYVLSCLEIQYLCKPVVWLWCGWDCNWNVKILYKEKIKMYYSQT